MTGASGTDLVIVAVGITAVIGAGYSVHRAVKSIRTWAEGVVELAKHGFSDAVDSSATGHLVKYHLGPNGTTTPMHVRVTENHDTELRHHKQNTEKLDAVIDRLEKVEQAQQAAATAVVVAEDAANDRREHDG